MKTVIIDTVDSFYQQCMDYVCEKNDMPHPSDKDYGKGWSMVRREWERVINKINLQGEAVLFIAHSVERERKKKHENIDVTQPDIPKTGINILYELCDIILYLGYDDQDERKLYGKPREHLVIGARGGIMIDDVEPSFDAIDTAIKEATGIDFAESKPAILIYGPPKIGKSTLAAQFPNPHVIDTERGYKFLKQVKEKHSCGDWSTCQEKLNKIFTKNGNTDEVPELEDKVESQTNEPEQGEL